MLLDFPFILRLNVSHSSSPILVKLHELQLDMAHALLESFSAESLPAPDVAPEAYLQAVIDGLCELSNKDPLTGLANRRYLRSTLEREIDTVARSGSPALLLMIDIDHFKVINDKYGHQAGDRVLQAVANCLQTCVRPKDTVARYGGEEFAVVMPDCPVVYGVAVAERIRESIANLKIMTVSMLELSITISVGGSYAPEWVRYTADLWIERSDSELYRAKSTGRNRVCLSHQEDLSVSAEEKSLLFGPLNDSEPGWIETVSGDVHGAAVQRVN